jgi:aldose 1-epimerase
MDDARDTDRFFSPIPESSADDAPAAISTDDAITLRMGRLSVVIAPEAGNTVVDMRAAGEPIVYFPYASVEEYRASGRLAGIPFLAPWANRLDEPAFYANGRRYAFDMTLGNVHGEIPIHGFLRTVPWQRIAVESSASAAWAVSRLEFYRHPAWMKQFPFAHTIEMTHRLEADGLQITTRLENLSAEPMPVSIGFHPYFQLTDAPREAWIVAIGARTHGLLNRDKIPTGRTEPIERRVGDPAAIPLADYDFDDVFSDLVRDGAGRAVMSVRGRVQRIDVTFGPRYRAAVVYAPRAQPAGPFICFEPMAAITDALNLAARGAYGELQTIPPRGTWTESFWIRPGHRVS